MDAKNRFPRGVKCTHLAGLAVSAARAAMGVAMADMCVAIETVDGCLSTTDSAAGDGSKTRDESTQQLALPTGLDTILAAIDFDAAARARASEVSAVCAQVSFRGRERGLVWQFQLITAFLTTGAVRRDFQKKEFRPESRPPGIPE